MTTIKDKFPSEEEAQELGGESDGFIFKTAFAGATLENSYDMIKAFLLEQGFTKIPLPKDAKELIKFKLSTRNKQILLFEENGYIHNPIKILFPINNRNKRTLFLEIYNENAPNNLLRFHGKMDND